jgi:hypothetical protein
MTRLVAALLIATFIPVGLMAAGHAVIWHYGTQDLFSTGTLFRPGGFVPLVGWSTVFACQLWGALVLLFRKPKLRVVFQLGFSCALMGFLYLTGESETLALYVLGLSVLATLLLVGARLKAKEVG